jgi:hypothetical protein
MIHIVEPVFSVVFAPVLTDGGGVPVEQRHIVKRQAAFPDIPCVFLWVLAKPHRLL